MKARNTVLSLLMLSAVCITPAYANFFSDPRSGTMLNVGSAPSPTPQQLRAIGDSDFGPGRPYYRERGVPPPSARYSEDSFGDETLVTMEGRTVFGARGERLGYVLAVDQHAREIELQTQTGIGVAMPASLIAVRGTRLVAPTISRADIRAMAEEQTGHIVALNID